MPTRRRAQKYTESSWSANQPKSIQSSSHDRSESGQKSSSFQPRPFVTSVEQSVKATTIPEVQTKAVVRPFDLTQVDLFSNNHLQPDPINASTNIPQIQRECGVDETCPPGMEYASSWDNNDPTSSHSGSVNSSGNASYSYGWGQQTTVGIDNDTYMSSSSGYNAGTSFNPNNGQVGVTGGYTQTTQIGDETDTRGVGGSGYLDFNANGELEGGGGSINASANGTSVNIGGGIVVSAQPPRLDTDGRYIVTWKRDYTGTAGGGHTTNGRGASASYEAKESTTGSRKFDTQSAAQAFYESGVWASLNPEDASQLENGDQISQTDSDQMTAGVSAEAMGLTVGANLTVGDTHSVEITGLGNQTISVKILDSSILGGALSLGAPGVSMTGGLQSTSSEGHIATFDLKTAAGQSAFQYLTREGQLPPSGRGYVLKANIEGSQTEESSGFSLAGTSVTNKNTTSETTTTYADGNRTVEERTGAESSGVTVPFLGSFSESDQLTATDDSNASNRTYSVSSQVNSSSTEDVNNELARSTGVSPNRVDTELSNQQSRRWTVTSSFSQSQIERLVREIRRSNWNHHALIYESGDGADFAAEVRAAGDDWDRIDRALTAFVSETGDNGLDLIRSTLGVSPRYSLTLQGDPYMTGEAGHIALTQKINRWTTQLDNQTSVRAAGSQIATELRQQRARLTAISDPERYPDLPNELRGQEMTRTEGEITDLESLQTRARDLAQQNNQSDQLMSVDPSLDPTANSSEMTDAQAVNLEWDAINAFETRMTDKRSDCIDIGNDARRAHWIHMGAYAQGPRSAYETWGERHWYGDDDHAGEYESAKSALDSANKAWDKAEGLWRDYRAAKSRLEFMEPSQIVGTLDSTLGDQQTDTFNKFSLALGLYRMARNRYDAIREAHPEASRSHFLAYIEGHQLPDELKLE